MKVIEVIDGAEAEIVIFGMNPLALNWTQTLFPVTIAWVRESLKRDRAIRAALDKEWLSLYRANTGDLA